MIMICAYILILWFSIKFPVKIRGGQTLIWKVHAYNAFTKGPPHHLWRVIPQTGPGKYYATTFCQKDFFQYVVKTFLSYVLHARLHRIRVTTRSKPTLAKGNIWEGMSNKITFSFHEYGFEDLCRGLKQHQHINTFNIAGCSSIRFPKPIKEKSNLQASHHSVIFWG